MLYCSGNSLAVFKLNNTILFDFIQGQTNQKIKYRGDFKIFSTNKNLIHLSNEVFKNEIAKGLTKNVNRTKLERSTG